MSCLRTKKGALTHITSITSIMPEKETGYFFYQKGAHPISLSPHSSTHLEKHPPLRYPMKFWREARHISKSRAQKQRHPISCLEKQIMAARSKDVA